MAENSEQRPRVRRKKGLGPCGDGTPCHMGWGRGRGRGWHQAGRHGGRRGRWRQWEYENDRDDYAE